MTVQAQRARVNMLLAKINNASAAFFAGISAMLMTAVFLLAVAAFVVPLGHYVVNYWSGFASSLQSPAPAKAAKK